MFSSENIPRMLTCLVIGLLLISLPSYKPISLLEKCYYWLPSVEGQWNVRHGFSLYWGCRTFFRDTILSWKGRPCCISLETKSVPGSAGPGVAGPLTPCALLPPPPPPPPPPLLLSLPLAPQHACLDGSSPAAVICSNGLPAYQVDFTSLEATLANPFCLGKCAC